MPPVHNRSFPDLSYLSAQRLSNHVSSSSATVDTRAERRASELYVFHDTQALMRSSSCEDLRAELRRDGLPELADAADFHGFYRALTLAEGACSGRPGVPMEPGPTLVERSIGGILGAKDMLMQPECCEALVQEVLDMAQQDCRTAADTGEVDTQAVQTLLEQALPDQAPETIEAIVKAAFDIEAAAVGPGLPVGRTILGGSLMGGLTQLSSLGLTHVAAAALRVIARSGGGMPSKIAACALPVLGAYLHYPAGMLAAKACVGLNGGIYKPGADLMPIPRQDETLAAALKRYLLGNPANAAANSLAWGSFVALYTLSDVLATYTFDAPGTKGNAELNAVERGLVVDGMQLLSALAAAAISASFLQLWNRYQTEQGHGQFAQGAPDWGAIRTALNPFSSEVVSRVLTMAPTSGVKVYGELQHWSGLGYKAAVNAGLTLPLWGGMRGILNGILRRPLGR